MAIWQCKFELFPVTSIHPSTPETQRWTGYDPDLLLESIAKLRWAELPCEIEGTRSWGAQEGDRIDVVMVAGMIAEVCLWLDTRKVALVTMDALVTVVRENGLAIAMGEDILVKPSLSAAIQLMTESDAFRCVKESWHGPKGADPRKRTQATLH